MSYSNYGGGYGHNTGNGAGNYNMQPNAPNYSGYPQNTGYGNDEAYEMNNYPATTTSQSNLNPPAQTQLDILDRCDVVSRQVEGLNRELEALERLDRKRQYDNSSATTDEINAKTQNLTARARATVAEMQTIRELPDADSARNREVVANTTASARKFLTDLIALQTKMEEGAKRAQIDTYHRMFPNSGLSDQDVWAKISSAQASGQGLYTQELLQSDRRDNAQTALTNAQSRNQEMASIHAQMLILKDLFFMLDQNVQAQAPLVENVGAEIKHTKADAEAGNREMSQTEKTARARNRKKRWCCVIAIIILLLIAAAIALAVYFTRNTASKA